MKRCRGGSAEVQHSRFNRSADVQVQTRYRGAEVQMVCSRAGAMVVQWWCRGGAEAVQRFRSRFRCSRAGCRVGPCRDRCRAGVDGGAVQVQTCRGAKGQKY